MEAKEGKVSTSASKGYRSDSNRKSNAPEPLLEVHTRTQSCRRKDQPAMTSQTSTSPEINPSQAANAEEETAELGNRD